MIEVVLCLSVLAATDAQAELTQAIIAFGRGDTASARKHLDEAEAQTAEPKLLAQIHRQRGIIDQVDGIRLAAVVSFLRALYFDPQIELSTREHRGEVQRLFSCARELQEAGLTERTVELRHAKDFEPSNWSCPSAAKLPEVAAPPPPPPMTPPPSPPPPEEDEGSVWTSPWLWIAVGVVVVAGGTTTAILLSRGPEPYGGTTDVNLELGN